MCRSSGCHVLCFGHPQHSIGSTTGDVDDHINDCYRHGHRAGRCLQLPAELVKYTVSLFCINFGYFLVYFPNATLVVNNEMKIRNFEYQNWLVMSTISLKQIFKSIKHDSSKLNNRWIVLIIVRSVFQRINIGCLEVYSKLSVLFLPPPNVKLDVFSSRMCNSVPKGNQYNQVHDLVPQ